MRVFDPYALLEGVEGGEKMNAFKVGIVALAILLVVSGIGFGIAQAGGTLSERPFLSFEDQESPQVANLPTEDMQPRNPTETGSLPVKNHSDSSIVETEGNMYREGGNIDGP